jgi:glucosylceramidase
VRVRTAAPAAVLALLLGAALSAGASEPAPAPTATSEILLTSAAGARQAALPNVAFHDGVATGTVITIFPDSLRQTIHGLGTSFTESSAFVLAHLDPARRREVMQRIYGRDGADFSLARTPIGACDFSVEGRYSYDDQPDDRDLAAFSVAPDTAGFDPARWPGIRDPKYDLLPMIREALAVKQGQPDHALKIVASAWTSPAWMKDIGTWYVRGTAENNWQGTGGVLKPEYVAIYADYLLRYLDAYAQAGVGIWALTPVNEPHGVGGAWESLAFTPETESDFVKQHLGPRLRAGRFADTRVLVFDQNLDGLEKWADTVFPDAEAAPFVAGAAIHWYASTFKVYEDVLERVHAKYPAFELIHTEACIDNLGTAGGGDVGDPVGYKESGWFGNDAFWWNPTATDWGYTVSWLGAGAADHPRYTPVHRYARDIIVGLDHWIGGWIDWNIVLDRDGGPNHAGNFCGAPIMIDTATGEVYYTPIFDVLSQFSRTIRPGDRAVRTHCRLDDGLDADALHACATLSGDGVLSVQLLNTTNDEIACGVQVGGRFATIRVPANAVETVRVRVGG